MTLHSGDHYILKIRIDNNFYDIDNLNSMHLKQNDSCEYRGKCWKITYVFYENNKRF